MTSISSSPKSFTRESEPTAKRFPGVRLMLRGCLVAAIVGTLGWLMVVYPHFIPDFTPRGRQDSLRGLLWLAWSRPVGGLLLLVSAKVLVGSFWSRAVGKDETS